MANSSIGQRGEPRRARPAARWLGLAAAALAALALLPLPGDGPSSPTALEAAALGLARPFTREEAVRIRIDDERRLTLDPILPPRDRAARADDWLVLDRRWLDGEDGAVGAIGAEAVDPRRSLENAPAAEARRPDALAARGEEGPATADGASARRSLSYVGAVMGEDAHVAITPPFVVLTRGGESLLLRLDTRPPIGRGESMPDWVRADAERGIVLARFDGFSGAEIGAGTIRLQRRFFGW